MALGTILGAAASGAAQYGLSKLFGRKQKSPTATLSSAQIPSINAGGLSTSANQGGVSVTSDAGRIGAVNSLASLFPQQADLLSKLRGSVAPGFSALRSSRLGEVETSRNRAISNLRDNLARRRVLGSSFGEDAISRTEAEFARERDRVASESFLQELELTQNLVNQEFETRRGEFETRLNELNLQADLATKLATSLGSDLAENARLKARLLADEQAASGAFFGQISQPFSDALGKGVGSLFSGGSNLGSSPAAGFNGSAFSLF